MLQGTFGSEETKELDVQNITAEHQQLLTPFMIQAGAAYNAKYHFECERTMQIMNKFSAIRFNRYSPGQIMRQHITTTYTHSLRKVSCVDDDYEGADLPGRL
jgi:hypothetical protein